MGTPSCTLTDAVDLLQLIGEPTRVRLLALLAMEELTVAEIVAVTQLAQSSVSTHLGKLREAALVRDRRSGPSTFYSLSESAITGIFVASTCCAPSSLYR